MINTKLLRKTLAHIITHPEKWDQGDWCGTSCCFAGHAVALGVPGAKLTVYKGDARVKLPGGEVLYVPDAAQAVLGLDKEEAGGLFDGENTLNQLSRKVFSLVRRGEKEAKDAKTARVTA